jgi:hypothetical protein
MKPIIDTKTNPIWLKESVWKPRYERTVKLVKESIDSLKSEGKLTSINAIIERSRILDSNSGKGISRNAIINNPEAYEYYKIHCSYKNKSNKSLKKNLEIPDRMVFKPDRDLNRLRRRYGKLTKAELVEKVLLLEEYICTKEQHWLNDIFSGFNS